MLSVTPLLLLFTQQALGSLRRLQNPKCLCLKAGVLFLITAVNLQLRCNYTSCEVFGGSAAVIFFFFNFLCFFMSSRHQLNDPNEGEQCANCWQLTEALNAT